MHEADACKIVHYLLFYLLFIHFLASAWESLATCGMHKHAMLYVIFSLFHYLFTFFLLFIFYFFHYLFTFFHYLFADRHRFFRPAWPCPVLSERCS